MRRTSYICAFGLLHDLLSRHLLEGGLRNLSSLLIAACLLSASGFGQKAESQPEWVATSNRYAKQLIDVTLKHRPEAGSQQGLAEYDAKIAQPTLADEDAQRGEDQAVLEKLKAALGSERDPKVKEDLEIMIRRVGLNFREEDFARAHEVPFFNASQYVFSGLRVLLDDQTPEQRRPAAVLRVREYAGLHGDHGDPEEAHGRADREARRHLPGEDGDRDGDGAELELHRGHRRADEET